MTAGVLAFINNYQRARYMARMDSSAYLSNTGGLTGAADGKQLTTSFWLASYSGTASRGVFMLGGSLMLYFQRNNNSTAYIKIEESGKIQGSSTATISIPTGTTATHFYIAVDMSSTSKRFVWVNGSAVSMTWSTYNNTNLTQTGTANIGNTNTLYIESDIYDFWYTNTYLAPSTYNSKFYNGGVSPNLGSNGQIPTGTAPLVYINGYGNLENRGTGGALTTGGSITQGEAAPI